MNNQPLVFGEVLFDHFPDGSRVLGGAPFNVAWHLQAFGLAPQFISCVGNDAEGQEISDLMTAWSMNLGGLQHDSEHPTGNVQVHIEQGEPHYDIVENSAFDFISAHSLSHQATQGILYHGSLALRNPVSRAALHALKARHQGKVFIDINLRAPWWQKEDLLPLLHDATWVKLNEHELVEFYPATDLNTAAQQFSQQFELDILFVTCGKQGAIAWDAVQKQQFNIKPSSNIAVVDTVGAGDAFASVLILGLSQQWAIQDTLNRAQTFASEVVGRRGATVADKAFYQRVVEQWN